MRIHGRDVAEWKRDRKALARQVQFVFQALFDRPAHPYTEALISAVPSPDPTVEAARSRIVLAGDPPSPMAPPPGCRFHTRCPKAEELCRTSEPELAVKSTGTRAACHLVE